MTSDWSTVRRLKGEQEQRRFAGKPSFTPHRPPSSPLAVSPVASPSASGVALKKERSSDDAITGYLASPSSARPFWLLSQRSPCPASNGERRHNLLPPSLASPPNRDRNRNTAFFICSPHRSAHGKKPNVALVKALLAFAAPNGAKIKATAYHPSPIRLSTEWVASQFFDGNGHGRQRLVQAKK
nr:hypothetical protein Iba_chr03cCG5870 [Ipomoea batatas]